MISLMLSVIFFAIVEGKQKAPKMHVCIRTRVSLRFGASKCASILIRSLCDAVIRMVAFRIQMATPRGSPGTLMLTPLTYVLPYFVCVCVYVMKFRDLEILSCSMRT